MAVVFVGGVHGVGKTTACESAARTARCRCFSASSLIREQKAAAIPVEGKAVADVHLNQELLIKGVKKVCVEHPGLILLDGHFVLRTGSGEIEAIPVAVFQELQIERIVCFRDDPAAIAARLQARDGKSESIDDVAELQKSELAQAAVVANRLGVLLVVLGPFDVRALETVLTDRVSSLGDLIS